MHKHTQGAPLSVSDDVPGFWRAAISVVVITFAVAATAVAAATAYLAWVEPATPHLTSHMSLIAASFVLPVVALASTGYAVNVAIRWGRGRHGLLPYCLALAVAGLAWLGSIYVEFAALSDGF